MNPLEPLIAQFAGLPGIGRKSAARIVFHLLNQRPELSRALGQSLLSLHEEISHCCKCGNYVKGSEICNICADSARNGSKICVVEQIQDLYTIEKAQIFDGYYYVLHGVLSPLNGVGPEQLKLGKMLEYIQNSGFEEVIIATNPTLEGDATAIYIKQQIGEFCSAEISVSRIASGLPVGGDLEYADRLSVARAIGSRYSF